MAYVPTVFCPVLLPPEVADSGGPGDAGDTGGPSFFYDTYLDNIEVDEYSTSGVFLTVQDVPAGDHEKLLSILMMNGGMLWHYPDDGTASLPDGNPITVSTLAIQLSPLDYNFMKTGLPEGIRPPAWWIIEGFDLILFKSLAGLLIDDVAEPAKQQVWDEKPPTDTSVSLDEHYYYRLMAGEVGVAVTPGTKIGDMGSDGVNEYNLIIRAFDTNGLEIHAAMLLANLNELNSDLDGHPVAVKAGQISTPIEIHLQFRYWNISDTTQTPKGSWNWLSGATVQVIDDDYNPDDVLVIGATDPDGKVSFFVPRDNFDGNDFYFLVSPATDLPVQYGSNDTWQDTWSTKGWHSVNGRPGYYENFVGYAIGSPDAPVLFNLGTPIFLQVRYYHQLQLKERPAAKGTHVHLVHTQRGDGIPEPGHITITVDKDGEFWGTLFNLPPDENIDIDLPLRIEDPAIQLPLTRIATPAYLIDILLSGFAIEQWRSADDPANGFSEKDFKTSMIGQPDPSKLQRIVVDRNFEDQAAGLFILKVIRDAHQWYYYLSGGDWNGVPDLAIYFNDVWPIGASVTPPNWGILYDKAHKWSRATIAHEYAHAVTWEYIAYTTFSLLWRMVPGYLGPFESAYISAHWFYKITNGLTAFMDGWSLLIELAFDHPVPWNLRTPSGIIQLEDFYGTTVPITNSPRLGLECEGCYAQAFWDYLNNQGLQPTPDSDNADLAVANPSLANPANQILFQQTIWQPMIALGDEANRADPGYVTVEDFINQSQSLMIANNFTNLQTHLTNWNL
jgi:hypothetical protein